MNEESQILFMQVRILKMFSELKNISLKESAEIFEKYLVLEYIKDCWEIFHIEGDSAVMEDVEKYLKSKGFEK